MEILSGKFKRHSFGATQQGINKGFRSSGLVPKIPGWTFHLQVNHGSGNFVVFVSEL